MTNTYKRAIMMETKNLSVTLNSKIDALLARFEILKSENEMLRDELSRTKELLTQQEVSLSTYKNNQGLQESEAQLLIDKLEEALAS